MNLDFEKAWLAKLARGLEAIGGKILREKIISGSEELSVGSEPAASAQWTSTLMERMDEMLGVEQARAVMAGCACEYPKVNLQPMREAYERTGSIHTAHRMLHSGFETFLRETLQLGDELAQRVIDMGWGVAGELKGNTIMAIKIPKSGNLVRYFEEKDPAIKRQLYCHCPRMQQVLRDGDRMPPLYCYCGAGFYKGIWEEIIRRPVGVEVLETVLDGGDVCRIAVHLPPDA
jgi:hypothetical protein